ncbi:SCO2584 family spore wall biosynthesis protein [Streptomyces cavernicola]
MPEDVGGTPSPDGREPDDDRDHGRADEEFAAVVFDEDFVRSAAFHEPSAVERLLAAAEARAEAEHRRYRDESGHDPERGDPSDPHRPRGSYHPHDAYDAYDAYDPYGHGPGGCVAHGSEECTECDKTGGNGAGRRAPGRWHRPVAWVLALVMGIGMVALAFSAVYRGNSSGRQDPGPPPATSGVDRTPSAPAGPAVPSLHADRSAPAP